MGLENIVQGHVRAKQVPIGVQAGLVDGLLGVGQLLVSARLLRNLGRTEQASHSRYRDGGWHLEQVEQDEVNNT